MYKEVKELCCINYVSTVTEKSFRCFILIDILFLNRLIKQTEIVAKSIDKVCNIYI